MLIPESREYPPVELLFKSAKQHCRIKMMLERKRNSVSTVAFTLLIVLAAVNTLLTIAVAIQ